MDRDDVEKEEEEIDQYNQGKEEHQQTTGIKNPCRLHSAKK
jgi:hypothetical protein